MKKETKEPMDHIAVYGSKRNNKRVHVIEVETLGVGVRIHFRHPGSKVNKVMGRNAFKSEYYNVAGLVV